MTEIQETVSNRLKILKKITQLSQTQLAEKSGVSKGTISKAFNEGKLSVATAKLVSKALGVSLDYLYGNSDIESIEQYAIDTINKHIPEKPKKISWGNHSYSFPSIIVSEFLADYWEKMEIIATVKIEPDLRDNWLKKENDKLLEAFKSVTSIPKDKCKEYALIPVELLTEEILNQLQVVR